MIHTTNSKTKKATKTHSNLYGGRTQKTHLSPTYIKHVWSYEDFTSPDTS